MRWRTGTIIKSSPVNAEGTIEEQVFLFVVRELGIKKAKLSLSSRLNHDLGMDGDDAVEFFEKFKTEFRVDLKPLGERWSEHFGPEGVSPVATLIALAGIVGCILIAALLERFVGVLPLWGWNIILIASFLGVVFFWLSKRESPFRSITIADLIEAARSGTWHERMEQNGGAARSE